ncbi:hypothetical protein [uncultured Helicobacter sp.]|nr:hypothetical protein [uncultured Helicobacter sp.]
MKAHFPSSRAVREPSVAIYKHKTQITKPTPANYDKIRRKSIYTHPT